MAAVGARNDGSINVCFDKVCLFFSGRLGFCLVVSDGLLLSFVCMCVASIFSA